MQSNIMNKTLNKRPRSFNLKLLLKRPLVLIIQVPLIPITKKINHLWVQLRDLAASLWKVERMISPSMKTCLKFLMRMNSYKIRFRSQS